MERKRVIGSADIGFGWTKIKVSNNEWKQPSIIGEARQLFDENIRPEDVQYKKDGKHYFVGDLALRHSLVKYAGTVDDKAKTWTTKILLETGLGIVAPYSDICLVTGLPVDFYFNQKNNMKELLNNFNSLCNYELLVGKEKRLVNPRIIKSKIVAQPFGSAMNYVLDYNGNIKNQTEANNKILVIDIGYYTLDLLILDEMEIGKSSCSLSGLGVDTAYKIIQDALKDKFGKTPNRYELDSVVLSKQFENYDITTIINRSFEALSAQINLEIKGLNTNFNKYIVTGGCSNLIAKHLDLPQDRVIIYDQMGNTRGYEKIGVRLWGKTL